MPTGRIQVAPGQTIVSAGWGNPLWDHSVQCFASAADRANQFPNPQPGAVSFTEDTRTLWVYASGAWVPLQFGSLAASGTATVNVTAVNVEATVAVTFPAGRFTAPPAVNVTQTTGPPPGWANSRASSITATGFVLGHARSSGTGNVVHQWTAVQAP
jgi:hypothetical protein